MYTATNQHPVLPEASASHNQQLFPPLESVTSPTVPTDAAAFYLNRRPQTLRSWTCLGNGPIHPRRINGRLAWSVKEIKKVLGVEV